MVVQQKWMYLEGIFIGGDIRQQLPEEAKKFDNIDKTFKKVNQQTCVEQPQPLCVYRIAGNFCGDFNLANWQIVY